MDKKTLSHYGWIVVWILTISVLLALATPFGKYVGNGIVSIAVGFRDALDKEASVEEITKDKENIDTILNGEFIITDKQGSEECYVYEVNNFFDAYSLTLSGVNPEINDRYFRCIRYVDIEELDTVKEMFYVAAQKEFNSIEQRQGISYYLLSLVNETDYTETVSSLGSVQLDTYNTLKASAGTIEEKLYENIKLKAIEKDGYIDMIFLEKKVYTIIETQGKGIMRILKFDNGEYVYCVDRHVKRPVVGCQYKEIEAPSDFNINDIEKAVFVLGKHQEDSYDFRVAAQCFLWSVIENEDLSHEVGQFVGADWDKAKTICDTLLADFNTITEYEKYDIRFYEYIEKPDEYQRLVGYTIPNK